MLATSGALGSTTLLLVTDQSTRASASTAIQLILLAVLLVVLAPRAVGRSIADSRERTPDELGSGEPTPLWHIGAIAIVLTLLAGGLGGWDAGLRVTGGCVLVGAVQALLLSRLVARAERRHGRRYYRVAGSRILRGTRLGHLRVTQEGQATRADSPSPPSPAGERRPA